VWGVKRWCGMGEKVGVLAWRLAVGIEDRRIGRIGSAYCECLRFDAGFGVEVLKTRGCR